VKTHYYPEDRPDSDMRTACGLSDGRKVGTLITSFFKIIKSNERCKTCNKRFKKDQHETPTNKTTKVQ